MFRVRPTWRFVVAAAGLTGALAALVPVGTPAQDSAIWGRTDVTVPERTDVGDWLGTWFFVSRDRKMALWFREQGGEILVKFRVEIVGRGRENFITDWDSRAEYRHRGTPATFAMNFDQRDANTVAGSWDWKLGTKENGRFETADFTIFRTGHGRDLVVLVENLERTYYGQADQTRELTKQVWSFRKASRRQALWAELPF